MLNRMLKFLELDMFIVVSLYFAARKGVHLTTWEMAKKFNWADKREFVFRREEYNFYQKKTNTVKLRLHEMIKDGLIVVHKENEKVVYELAKEKFIKKHIINGKNVLTIQIKRKDGKYVLLEL